MARKESPENHVAAIAAVAAISLVLIQTITDRVLSGPRSHASSAAADACTRPISARNAETISAAIGSQVRVNCLQSPKARGDRLGPG
jgi:hypothetical protein